MPRRLRLATAVALCLFALCGTASAAAPQFSRSDVKAMAEAMAAPWPGTQDNAGTFDDYTDHETRKPDTRYGDAFMGYALVVVGLRTGDEKLIDSGLRGVSYSVRHWAGERKRITQSVFENWAVPATYNLARRKLADNPIFKQERKRWEDFLRISRAERSGITFEYGNHWLTDAQGVIETLRTGLHSSRSDAVLGGQRSAARSGAYSLVNQRVPALAPHGGRPFILNDPPDNPMAYEGLTLGMYAHLIRMMGSKASGRAKDTLRRATKALWYDTAPDGDNGYFGRSQEILWGSAGTAYGALVAANLNGTSSADAARFRALADRAFARLRDGYPIGARGQFFVPGLAKSIDGTMPWLDGYAGAPSMDGLALLFVELSLGELKSGADVRGIASDHRLSRGIGSGYGRIAMVRRGPVWFALRLKPTVHRHHIGDLRYDSGLAIAKHRRDDGGWEDIVPVRPTTIAPGFDGAGPDIVSGGSVQAVADGDRLSTSTGRVRVSGAIRNRSLHDVAPYRASYVAVSCGVELLFAAYPGRTYEYSAFFRGNDLPKRDGGKLSDGDTSAKASPTPDSVQLERGYGSSVDPRLVRARMRFRVSKARTVHVRMC